MNRMAESASGQPETIEVLRTPDGRFSGIPEFDYEPRYLELGELRIHYVDEGPPDAPVVLMLHGEPTWSFLYRKMIPRFLRAGYRIIAPDFVGFGRSDKPVNREDYTYRRHVQWMTQWFDALDLKNVTLVGQDWGSLIGLRMALWRQSRFDRIVMANGALPTGEEPLPRVFKLWRTFARYSPWFPVGWIVRAGCRRRLSRATRRAYDAPFPDAASKAGARAFPALVPSSADDPEHRPNLEAWKRLTHWQKPFLTLYGSGDPITRPMARIFQRRVPGARGQPHEILRGTGHFIQEDSGRELADRIVSWMDATDDEI